MSRRCPKCGCQDVAVRRGLGAAPNGVARIECIKCGRFIEWRKDATDSAGNSKPVNAEKPESKQRNDQPASEELDQPDLWLYISRRLELEYLPNVPCWSLPVITFGPTAAPTAFYRLSARTLVWLEKAGEQLEVKVMRGEVARDQLDAYLAAMTAVWDFANAHISPEAVRAARGKSEELPVAEGPK